MPRGSNRVPQEQAELEMRAAGYEPQSPYPGAGVKWPSRCLGCGEERSPTLQNVRKGARCKVCDARRRADASRTPHQEALAILLAHGGTDPVVPYRGKLHPWSFRCGTCGALQENVTLNHVEQGAWKCGACQNSAMRQEVDGYLRAGSWTPAGEWETLPFAARHECGAMAEITQRRVRSEWRCSSCRREENAGRLKEIAERYGWRPLEVPTRLSDAWLLEHRCGHRSRFWPASIGRYGEMCSRCAISGFRPSDDAFVYLLSLAAYNALKIGISNNLPERLKQHARNFAFDEERVIGPLPGSLAQAVESHLLALWERSGTRGVIPASIPGWTETTVNRPDTLSEATSFLDAVADLKLERFSVTPCSHKSASDLMQAHYTGTLPRGVATVGLWLEEMLCGAASFGVPSYPGVAAAVAPDMGPGTVVELRRLFLRDGLPRNTASWFLGRALRELPSDTKLVVAFSDPAVGHHGGLYQATNFLYDGETTPSYHYEDPDGNYVHKRGPWNRAKAAGRSEREQAELDGLRRVDDPPKHRYVYPLDRRLRRTLKSLPYPKPEHVDIPPP